MSASLEYSVEELIADLVKLRPELPEGFQVVHFASDSKALGDRVVIKAEVGEQQLGGCRPYVVNVTVDARMSQKDSSLLDAVFSAIEKAISNKPEVIPASAGAFAFFRIMEEGENDRERAKNSRKRTRKFQVLAKEKP